MKHFDPLTDVMQWYGNDGVQVSKPYTSIKGLTDRLQAMAASVSGDDRVILEDAAEMLISHVYECDKLAQENIDLRQGLRVTKIASALEVVQHD